MKNEVGKILNDLGKVDEKKMPTKNGNLDMTNFYQVKEVKEAIKKLEDLGITNHWLFENGFVVAGMMRLGISKK